MSRRKEREHMKKKISKMTEKEILRQQMELLAEKSNTCEADCLAGITNSMLDIYSVLEPKDSSVL